MQVIISSFERYISGTQEPYLLILEVVFDKLPVHTRFMTFLQQTKQNIGVLFCNKTNY
jgi:hypothetical protein